jgi:hypothetical protein
VQNPWAPHAKLIGSRPGKSAPELPQDDGPGIEDLITVRHRSFDWAGLWYYNV